jgi:hypothetical protein
MTKSARARAFEAENGKISPQKPRVDLVVSPDAQSGTLIDIVDPTALKQPVQPADIPEKITQDEDPVLPEAVMRAFANIVKTLNMRGRIQGIDTMDQMTGYTNRFRTETKHSDEVREWMDGKEIAFTGHNEPTDHPDTNLTTPSDSPTEGDVKDLLEATFGPGTKEIIEDDGQVALNKKAKEEPSDSEADYDVLNDTAARLAAGEDPAKVVASRNYLKAKLEEKLKTVPAHKVGTGDIPQPPMNAKIRNKIVKDPHAIKNLLDPILMRSK